MHPGFLSCGRIGYGFIYKRVFSVDCDLVIIVNAAVVDDLDMKVSHVVRGADHA